MLRSAVCQRHKSPPGMRNSTRLALHISSKNECSSEHLAHGLYAGRPLRPLGIENDFISAAQECGAEELEEASSLSGDFLSGNDIHENRFYVLRGILLKETSNRAQARHVQTTARRRKYLLAFDVLRCGLILEKWNQKGDGAEGLVPLITFD